jgi:hypothetical protein
VQEASGHVVEHQHDDQHELDQHDYNLDDEHEHVDHQRRVVEAGAAPDVVLAAAGHAAGDGGRRAASAGDRVGHRRV